MKTEIVIKLPLFKRWLLRLFIGGLLQNLEKIRRFYKEHAEYSGIDTKVYDSCYNQQRGIEQSINAVRRYCGMKERDFYSESILDLERVCVFCGKSITDCYVLLDGNKVHNTVNCVWGYSKKVGKTFKNVKTITVRV